MKTGKGEYFFSPLDYMVENPFFFDNSKINEHWINGFHQAIYAIRCKMSTIENNTSEIYEYTNFLVDVLRKIKADTL
jgi:hypothetical protein